LITDFFCFKNELKIFPNSAQSTKYVLSALLKLYTDDCMNCLAWLPSRLNCTAACVSQCQDT